MRKTLENTNKKSAVFTGTLFAAFALLVLLFPYTGDDWAWGSKIGMERLATWFDNYNGRYAGNLLVMALTRSKAFNVIFTALSMVAVCWLPKRFSGSRRFFPYALAALLILLMPRGIFVQSVAWTAGFSNYVPPIMLTLAYFCLIGNIFEKAPQYRPGTSAAAAAIGFVSALFMENVTLYNIAVSGLILIFVLVKFRKVFLVHVLHFAGSVCGAVVMFTNSAYGAIASGDDTYRSTAANSGLKNTVISHTETIFQQFFVKNVVTLSVLSVLCIALVMMHSKGTAPKKQKKFAAGMVFVNVFSLLLICAKCAFPGWTFFLNKFLH